MYKTEYSVRWDGSNNRVMTKTHFPTILSTLFSLLYALKARKKLLSKVENNQMLPILLALTCDNKGIEIKKKNSPNTLNNFDAPRSINLSQGSEDPSAPYVL